jgi:hypothetical protein
MTFIRAAFSSILVVVVLYAAGTVAFGYVPHGPLWMPLVVVVAFWVGLDSLTGSD